MLKLPSEYAVTPNNFGKGDLMKIGSNNDDMMRRFGSLTGGMDKVGESKGTQEAQGVEQTKKTSQVDGISNSSAQDKQIAAQKSMDQVTENKLQDYEFDM